MLDDWADITPPAITIAEDVTPVGAYSPAIVGPDTTPSTGEMPNAIKGRLRVGVLSDYIVLDPNSPLRMSMYAGGTEQLRVGNLNGFLGYASDLYGIAIGNTTSYLKYEGTNGLRTSGAIQGGTIDIGGSDASSFHVDSAGNIWLGAAAYNIATNPFAVSAAGALRAASGAIAGFTIDGTEGLYAGSGATRVQMKPGAGFWTGATAFASAPFRVSEAGALVATSVTITGAVNATSGSFVGGYLSNMTLGKTGVASGILTLQLAGGTGDTYIASGKTDFTNVQSGFIIGIDDSDSDTPKLYIGSSTKYLNWDGTNLTITGATLASVDATGTTSDIFTVNSDLTDANADLVLGRTTGGNTTLRWNGTIATIDKDFAALAGFHVGSNGDPGDGNLIVDGSIGIGVAVPGSKLHVENAAGDVTIIAMAASGSYSTLNLTEIGAGTTLSGGRLKYSGGANTFMIGTVENDVETIAITLTRGGTQVAVAGSFACNGAAVQSSYTSGGALSAYGAGANGLDSGANMSALHAMVVKIRAALVANGIMS